MRRDVIEIYDPCPSMVFIFPVLAYLDDDIDGFFLKCPTVDLVVAFNLYDEVTLVEKMKAAIAEDYHRLLGGDRNDRTVNDVKKLRLYTALLGGSARVPMNIDNEDQDD